GRSWRTSGSFGEDPHAWSQPPARLARSPKFRRSEARIRNTAHADRGGRRGYPPRTGGCPGRGSAVVAFHAPRGRKQELGDAGGRSQDDVVFIPLSTAKSRVLGAVRGTTREALDFISIKVSDATAMSEMERETEALLRQRHRIRGDAPSDFRIENPADVLIARGAAVRILGILLIAVAAVSLVVGGISIMNIMLVSVTERTREIGLRMAVGASRRDIRWQFLIEALILALMGGLVGAVLGAAAAVAIAWKAGWPILIIPWAIILAWGFAGFIGISFGLYPAHRAARLDPIAALRFE